MNKIKTAVSRVIRTRPTTDQDVTVHFHQGAQGNPAACFDERCTRPALEV